MSHDTYRDWLRTYKHVSFHKYLLLPVHRKLELLTEFENDGLVLIQTCAVKGHPELKKFCREYMDYDYGTASNKQREYLKDEFKRYKFTRDIANKGYSYAKWLHNYAFLDYDKRKKYADKSEIEYEYSWFCSMPWEYEPMHFDRWLSVFLSISPERYFRYDMKTRDKYRTFFLLDYLHDCAFNSEENWIACLGSNVNGVVSDLYSESEFNEMYDDPDYHGWGIISEELIKEDLANA